MKMKDTKFKEIKILSFQKREDSRGTMVITFDDNEMKIASIPFRCKEQRMYTMPQKGTFFGIHFQLKTHPQDKIVHLLTGRGIDYIVDFRKTSKTYKKWISIELLGGDNQCIYIPQGYGHAFLSLEDNTTMLFTVNEHFYKEASKQIHYQDHQIHLELPIEVMHISNYDKNAPGIDQVDYDV